MVPAGFLGDTEGFRWVRASAFAGRDALELTSQVWRDHRWNHGLVVSVPPRGATVPGCVLHVTGGPANEPDLLWADGLALVSGMNVATLFDIPVQPLWGFREDDLIAHTFEMFLESGDDTWPLLMPMVRSVTRAMDALAASGLADGPFVVTGASKRGWTSWLAGCTGDPRIAGIAPMVFDFLKMPEQLEKQARDWGVLSPMISDYTTRELEESVDTDNGARLLGLVDPAQNLGSLRVPVLMILGTNDAYWTVDAHTLYWEDVTVPKNLVMVPNMAHGWGSTDYWTPTLAAFSRGAVAGGHLPQWTVPGFWPPNGPTSAEVCPSPGDVLWSARSADRNFTAAEWASSLELSRPVGDGWTAAFVARRLEAFGLSFWTSTPVRVTRDDPR
ncbi:MAG: PhoPQ-activated pathogenicity-like protein PqaA type [Armatimonadetes bacterium]|nr:PhoPQ-activated pathogenicity-like protein PqaA type [Armatimonadota bacterium]